VLVGQRSPCTCRSPWASRDRQRQGERCPTSSLDTQFLYTHNGQQLHVL